MWCWLRTERSTPSAAHPAPQSTWCCMSRSRRGCRWAAATQVKNPTWPLQWAMHSWPAHCALAHRQACERGLRSCTEEETKRHHRLLQNARAADNCSFDCRNQLKGSPAGVQALGIELGAGQVLGAREQGLVLHRRRVELGRRDRRGVALVVQGRDLLRGVPTASSVTCQELLTDAENKLHSCTAFLCDMPKILCMGIVLGITARR